MRQFQFNGDHDGPEGACIPDSKDYPELVLHYKTRAAEAQAESDTSPGKADLLAASSVAHQMHAAVLVACATTENNEAMLAESEFRLAVAFLILRAHTLP